MTNPTASIQLTNHIADASQHNAARAETVLKASAALWFLIAVIGQMG